MDGGSAPLDPHLLVALPEAASSLALGNACPGSRMDTAFTGMPVESETRPNAVRLSSFALSLSKGEWASTGSARTSLTEQY